MYCHSYVDNYYTNHFQNRMINVIHNMGGSIRKDMVSKVTHLIASSCTGEKYRYAATFNVPVMTEAWVFSCWEKRNEVGFSATSDEMVCGAIIFDLGIFRNYIVHKNICLLLHIILRKLPQLHIIYLLVIKI